MAVKLEPAKTFDEAENTLQKLKSKMQSKGHKVYSTEVVMYSDGSLDCMVEYV